MNAAVQPKQWLGTGRRKSSVARVFLRPGTGEIKVNGRSFEDYFPREIARMDIEDPLVVTETKGQFDIVVRVRGGGLSGQAGAMRHGITRALIAHDKEHNGDPSIPVDEHDPNLIWKPILKRAGFVTRDARRVERKKYGQPGARANFQFSKR